MGDDSQDGGGFLDRAAGWIESGLETKGKFDAKMDLAEYGAKGLGMLGTLGNATRDSKGLWSAWQAVERPGRRGPRPARSARQGAGPGRDVSDGLELAGNVALAGNDIRKEGFKGAYHDQEFYNHLGAAGLAGAHLALPAMGPYGEMADLALTGGEMAAEYGGKASKWAFGDKAEFSPDGIAGGLIRGTFGDKSLGEKARQGVGSVFGHGTAANIAGGVADVAVNTAMLPVNLGNTVGKGLFNYGSTVVNSIAHGEGAVGGFLNHAGHSVADGLSTAGQFVGNTASTIGHGISDTASTVGHAITHNPVASAISSVASW